MRIGTLGVRRPRTPRLLPGAIVALLAGLIITFTLDVRAILRPESRPAAPTGEAVAWPKRELPREWRWERDAVRYEHMYRKHDRPKLDWIRESGSRRR